VNNDLPIVRETIAEALRPGHFFVKLPMRLTWEHLPAEELAWEIFHGRLLDAAQTRSKQTFESWNIHWITPEGRSAEPLLSVKLDWAGRRLYVTRGILSYVWEPYDAGGNVILSREARKWVRELVAVVGLPEPVAVEHLRKTLAHRLFQAVVGVSRLPLTSVEAPLPNFTLGHLAYYSVGAEGGGPEKMVRSYRDLLNLALSTKRSWSEKGKLLELLLRSSSANELADGAVEFVRRWHEIGHTPEDIPKLVVTMFDEVALSPYTDFVDKTIRFFGLLEEQGALGPEQHADLVSSLLRRIGRHLTAFDLVTFHHRGANYPDALLLDALLKAYLALAERRAGLFLATNEDTPAESRAKRLRRRGLRQGWLLRRLYEGHPVPDTPTSPGENARVLPPEFPHVTDEQILNPLQRTRLLFANEPLVPQLSPTGEQVLKESIADLEHPAELQELGTALFLDRPLGVFKHPAEPDQTILLSYEAFSLSLAARRIEMLAGKLGLLSEEQTTALAARLNALAVPGVPIERSGVSPRPGVPSLQDALRVADDFVLVRSTKRAVMDFLAQYNLSPVRARFAVEWLTGEEPMLIAGSGSVAGTRPGTLRLFDSDLQLRLEFEMEPGPGYTSGLMGEFPRHGLRLVRIWQKSEGGQPSEREIRQEQIWLLPRD
jgi:hypothetical protein